MSRFSFISGAAVGFFFALVLLGWWGFSEGLGAAMITLLVAFAVLAFVAWLEQGR